jgi:hypothetical protein
LARAMHETERSVSTLVQTTGRNNECPKPRQRLR